MKIVLADLGDYGSGDEDIEDLQERVTILESKVEIIEFFIVTKEPITQLSPIITLLSIILLLPILEFFPILTFFPIKTFLPNFTSL